jgi:hypothetical protein
VFGIALGYEDLNDHEDLRHDPDGFPNQSQCEPGSRNAG